MYDQRCSHQIIIFIGDFRFGGAEVVGVNLANAFVAHGFHVRVIVLRKDGSLLPRLNKKVEIISLESKIITSLPKLIKQLIALNFKTISRHSNACDLHSKESSNGAYKVNVMERT